MASSSMVMKMRDKVEEEDDESQLLSSDKIQQGGDIAKDDRNSWEKVKDRDKKHEAKIHQAPLYLRALRQMLVLSKIDNSDTKAMEKAADELLLSLKDLRTVIFNKDDFSSSNQNLGNFSDGYDHTNENGLLEQEIDGPYKLNTYGTCSFHGKKGGYISVHRTFLSRLRYVMGDDFMQKWDLSLHNEHLYEQERVFASQDMMITALDLLMTERIEFLNELNTLYELEDDRDPS